MEPPIYEYDRFCEKLGVEPFVYPLDNKFEYSYSIGYKDIKFPSQNTIRIVSFNTALLSCMPKTDISHDKMWIGQRQVKSLMKYGIIPSDDVHYTIALFHHAERFLHPNEICEYDGRVATLNLLRKNVDLILCGHTETGGRPALQKQLGGGMILTAGATYYSDTHPNAFSIICIPDNIEDVMINPFTYENGWKNYSIETGLKLVEDICDLPVLGDIKEKCQFIIRSKDKKYKIPLKRMSVRNYIKDGLPYIQIDNRKEVLRYLDIQCTQPVGGRKLDVSISLAPKMERDVRAILKREECFDFLEKSAKEGNETEIYIETFDGMKLIYGTGFNGNIEVDKDSIKLLKKIETIEDFYDIRFYRPDELYDGDNEKINLICELIENGYTQKLILGQRNSTNFSELEKLTHFHKQIVIQDSFYLSHEGIFYCELFGVKFKLGKVLIIAGPYHADEKDIRYKCDTFKNGDSRQIIFTAEEDYQTYFITDIEKFQNNVIIPEYEIFQVRKIDFDWGFISEEKQTDKK